jgi:hypothetical protein
MAHPEFAETSSYSYTVDGAEYAIAFPIARFRIADGAVSLIR